METLVENPAISLTPDMILGLLEELSNLESPFALQLCGLLAEHPVSRFSRARSLGASPLDSSGAPMDLSLASPRSSSDSPDNQTTGSENSLVQDASRAVDGETGNRCCRNGVKRTTFNAPVKRNRKFGGAKEEGYVEEDDGEVLTGDIEGVRRGDKGGIEETAGGGGGASDDEDVTEGSEYNGGEDDPFDVSGRKRKGKGGRRAKKSKKVKKDTPPRWLTDGSPPDLFEGTDAALSELSRIISNDGLQSLADLTQVLINPASNSSVDPDNTLTLASLIATCIEEDLNQKLADFRHMILLIRLAFHLER